MRVAAFSRLATAAVVALALMPLSVLAQGTGTIAGTVTGPDGEPVRGAQVVVEGLDIGALSAQGGSFLIRSVPTGTHVLRVTQLGFAEAVVRDVAVRSDATTEVRVQLETAAIPLGGVVVSASRSAERITEAPATVARIDAPEIQLSVGNSFSGALKEVQGLDYIQTGATTAAINARGFNSSFNNRMLMLVDNRVSVLPESGLPIGGFTAIPKVDLASAEVIVGPGAALYGADATSGVLSLQTKDPLEYPGTTVEVAAGVLEKDGADVGGYSDVQFRHAGVIGNFGFKVAGEYQEADDWSNRVNYASGGVEYPEIGADFQTQVSRAEGALVYYGGLNRLELSAGYSSNDGVGQTNVGRNQFEDWTYNFVQLQGSTPHWYANVYRNQSQSGSSYAINRYSVNRALPAFDGMSDEEVMLESDWPSDARLFGAEVQNNFTFSDLIDGESNPFLDTEVVWGGQFRRDVVDSDREWLTDRFSNEDVTINTWGLYGQTRTPLHEKLDMVLALRYDEHDNYDSQISPKAGLIYKPVPNHALRVTYNRAFKSPTILQTNFWIPDFNPFIGVFGNTQGFTVRDTDGNVIATYDPVMPEENTTWEIGYKSVFGERLFLDLTGYYSDYENFFSPLVTIADPLGALGGGVSTAHFGNGTEPILGDTGNPQIVLTYFNLGAATVYGTDLAARYMVSDKVSVKATFSWIDLESRETGPVPAGEEATALNAPSTKWTLGADVRDLNDFLGGATIRHVTGYDFTSGVNTGHIPTFTTLDLTGGYMLERYNTQLTLNVTNLFSCRSADEAIEGDDGGCGFGQRHREMVNMPQVGTMVFLGVRYHHP